MFLDFNKKGQVQVDIKYYAKNVIENYPCHVKPCKCPWNDQLLTPDANSPVLNKEEQEVFHSTVMQGMFLVKRGRPDAEPACSYSSTRVQCSTEHDRSKLEKVLGHLLHTIEDVLTLEANNENNSHWHTDASFAVHPDMRSHTGDEFTLGKGCISGSSTKQKVNARSTTESELTGVDDKVSKIV